MSQLTEKDVETIKEVIENLYKTLKDNKFFCKEKNITKEKNFFGYETGKEIITLVDKPINSADIAICFKEKYDILRRIIKI